MRAHSQPFKCPVLTCIAFDTGFLAVSALEDHFMAIHSNKSVHKTLDRVQADPKIIIWKLRDCDMDTESKDLQRPNGLSFESSSDRCSGSSVTARPHQLHIHNADSRKDRIIEGKPHHPSLLSQPKHPNLNAPSDIRIPTSTMAMNYPNTSCSDDINDRLHPDFQQGDASCRPRDATSSSCSQITRQPQASASHQFPNQPLQQSQAHHPPLQLPDQLQKQFLNVTPREHVDQSPSQKSLQSPICPLPRFQGQRPSQLTKEGCDEAISRASFQTSSQLESQPAILMLANLRGLPSEPFEGDCSEASRLRNPHSLDEPPIYLDEAQASLQMEQGSSSFNPPLSQAVKHQDSAATEDPEPSHHRDLDEAQSTDGQNRREDSYARFTCFSQNCTEKYGSEDYLRRHMFEDHTWSVEIYDQEWRNLITSWKNHFRLHGSLRLYYEAQCLIPSCRTKLREGDLKGHMKTAHDWTDDLYYGSELDNVKELRIGCLLLTCHHISRSWGALGAHITHEHPRFRPKQMPSDHGRSRVSNINEHLHRPQIVQGRIYLCPTKGCSFAWPGKIEIKKHWWANHRGENDQLNDDWSLNTLSWYKPKQNGTAGGEKQGIPADCQDTADEAVQKTVKEAETQMSEPGDIGNDSDQEESVASDSLAEYSLVQEGGGYREWRHHTTAATHDRVVEEGEEDEVYEAKNQHRAQVSHVKKRHHGGNDRDCEHAHVERAKVLRALFGEMRPDDKDPYHLSSFMRDL